MNHSDNQTTLTGALVKMQRKIINLTMRNPLLNFKHAKGRSLRFVQGNLLLVYAKLLKGDSINVRSLPKLNLFYKFDTRVISEQEKIAVSNGIPISYEITTLESIDELQTLYTEADLSTHCRKIINLSASTIEETGSNALFLVFGFLEFLDGDKTAIAPLLSVPVTLESKSTLGISQFTLRYTGDDILENVALQEKLRNDFNLNLPLFEEEADNSLADYFEQVHISIQKLSQFKFKNMISLCLLDIESTLLFRDLEPSQWLLDHPIVRKAIEGAGSDSLFMEPKETPIERYAAEEGAGAAISLIYDADSSQHAALVDAVVHGKDMVIHGPPGTGKSQTITNLIAASIAEGKKVLFVAQKLTALEIVKNRLSKAGLGAFVMELHSNKSSKISVLDQIRQRMNFTTTTSNTDGAQHQELERYRNDLKAYNDLINSTGGNQLGLTLHQLMWRAEKHRQLIAIDEAKLRNIEVANAFTTTEYELAQYKDKVKLLASQYSKIGRFSFDHPFWGFYPNRLLREDETLSWLNNAPIWSKDLSVAAHQLTDLLNLQPVAQLVFPESQLKTLKDILDSTDQTRTSLAARIFSQNGAAGVVQTRIDDLQKFQDLDRKMFSSFENEPKVALLDQLPMFKIHTDSLQGISVQSQTVIEALITHADQLMVSSNQINSALTDIQGIRHPPTRTDLEKIAKLSHLALSIPMNDVHLQRIELTQGGALQALVEFQNLQNEWLSLENALSESLYLDALPQYDDLKQAMVTLRRGQNWNSVFDSKWRSAQQLYRNLQRNKSKKTSSESADKLGQLIKMLDLKVQWQMSPVWDNLLKIPTQSLPVALDGYLALVQWNAATKAIVSDLGITSTFGTPDEVQALRTVFMKISPHLELAVDALRSIDRVCTVSNNEPIATIVDHIKTAGAQLSALGKCSRHPMTLNEILVASRIIFERAQLRDCIELDPYLKTLLGDIYRGTDTDPVLLSGALQFGHSINNLGLPDYIKQKLLFESTLVQAHTLCNSLDVLRAGWQHIQDLETALLKLGQFNLTEWVGAAKEDDFNIFAQALYAASEHAAQNQNTLVDWCQYLLLRKEAIQTGLEPFVQHLENESISSVQLLDIYMYCFYNTILSTVFENFADLGKFTGVRHDQIRKNFIQTDKDVIELRGRDIANRCLSRAQPPQGTKGARVKDRTEMFLLEHLKSQTSPRLAVRQMMKRAGRAIQELKPCFMMGPQAVAKYLPLGQFEFDLVVMDEASQLKPEEALGAIARGSQLIVVGDAKQLPPTSFFSKNMQDDDTEDNYVIESESILDVCMAQLGTNRTLRWHYRSQHQSLIEFSNKKFYNGDLIVFPSPYLQGGSLGVKAVYLRDAVYEDRVNKLEAEQVVSAMVLHIAQRPEESLGVVTLNTTQQELIDMLWEQRKQNLHQAQDYCQHWNQKGQPLFIKNLESVQGDERDAIIISTTFGKPPHSSAVRQNFGPISREDGWRRLNVLFTRAKRSVTLYTSLRPQDVSLSPTTPRGTKVLREYLEYVQQGFVPAHYETNRDPDSDFEIAVIKVLREHGYEVTPQLGVAGYRIDIAVKHPNIPGSYLAAIECDGATYHSALSVRDRDRIRQEIIESLGWRGRVWRIWSTDWFRSPRQETQRLVTFLNDLRQNWTPEPISGNSWIELSTKQDGADA